MDGSPSSVLTMGLGSWGSVNLLTTLGYGIAGAAPETGSPDQTFHARPRGEVFHSRPRGEVFHGKGR